MGRVGTPKPWWLEWDQETKNKNKKMGPHGKTQHRTERLRTTDILKEYLAQISHPHTHTQTKYDTHGNWQLKYRYFSIIDVCWKAPGLRRMHFFISGLLGEQRAQSRWWLVIARGSREISSFKPPWRKPIYFSTATPDQSPLTAAKRQRNNIQGIRCGRREERVGNTWQLLQALIA